MFVKLKKAEVTELSCMLYYLVSLRCTFWFLIKMQLIECKSSSIATCWSFWFIIKLVFLCWHTVIFCTIFSLNTFEKLKNVLDLGHGLSLRGDGGSQSQTS